jgi:hypothetical protein
MTSKNLTFHKACVDSKQHHAPHLSKSVGEKMGALLVLEEKKWLAPNGSVAIFGSRCRKYRRSGGCSKRLRRGSGKVSISEQLAL